MVRKATIKIDRSKLSISEKLGRLTICGGTEMSVGTYFINEDNSIDYSKQSSAIPFKVDIETGNIKPIVFEKVKVSGDGIIEFNGINGNILSTLGKDNSKKLTIYTFKLEYKNGVMLSIELLEKRNFGETNT